MLHLFKRKAKESNDTSGQLIARIVSRIPGVSDLEGRLSILAEALAELPGHTGAMLIGFDGGGLPFCYRGKGIFLREDISPFTALAQIRQVQLEESYSGGEWAEVPPRLVHAPGAAGVEARFLRGADRLTSRGMVLIARQTEPKVATRAPLSSSEVVLQFIEWTIRDALHDDTMRIHANLLQLATDGLSRERLTIQPTRVAEELLRIFSAEAVTLLVERLGRLFLCATTDDGLRSSSATSLDGKGLTTFVMEAGQALRLCDATDAIEIKERAIGEIRDSSKLENLTRSGQPYRLLVVPMRIGKEGTKEDLGKIAGVIRVLRKNEAGPFTSEEEKTLQRFADLLGAELDASWILNFYGHIRRGESEAICISRSERRAEAPREPLLVYANPGARSLFGFTDDNILMDLPVKRLYSSDSEYERVRQLIRAARDSGHNEVGPILARLRRYDGELRFGQLSFRLVIPDLKPVAHYTVAIIRDITESHQLEDQHRRLMALLDKQGLAYFLSGSDGRTVNPTKTDSRLTGYSADELRVMSREQFYSDSTDREILLTKVRAADGALVRTLQRLRRADNTHFFAEGTIHLLKDSEDRMVGYEGIYEDVTERIRLQGYLDADTDRVLHEKELLEKLRENLTFNLDYTKSLNHQLGTPLAAILHTLLNLQEQLGSEGKWGRSLDRAVAQARTWRRLIDNFGFMDKLLRGDDFDFRPINIVKLAKETADDFNSLLREKKLSLAIDASSLERLISEARLGGHESLLRQAVVNLMDNAVKYSHPKTDILVRGFDAGIRGRVLEISNKGIGVPKNERENVFLRGYRTETARDATPDGFGLGLWLVQKIVRVHGASIRCAESEEERTAFRIYFPREWLKRSVRIGM